MGPTEGWRRCEGTKAVRRPAWKPGVYSSDIAADPKICFGRYRLVAHRITCAAVGSRFLAGESIRAIANDYEISQRQVLACIRWALGTRDWRSK